VENDCTHGGDGIFVRVLNGWVSTGNVFEGNDCSYANNNCVESWSPGNTWTGNKASHGSYGFWMGGSDKTVLIDNEASYNGLPDGMHNSPHLPKSGHAGIVFMFGPSSHTIVRGNSCAGNNGAGIALIGDMESKGAKWRAQHWIIEQNALEANRWGIYMQYADWINLGANVFKASKEADVQDAGGVTNLVRSAGDPRITRPPKAVLEGPAAARMGQPVVLDAARSSDPAGNRLRFRWDLGDGTTATEARVEHAFKQPGFYRIGLTVNDGLLSDLAWRDFYVVEDVKELGTEGEAEQWGWIDPQSAVKFSDDREVKISGSTSVFAMVRPYSGGWVSLLYPKSRAAGLSLAGKKSLVFWLKTVNENVPAWQGPNPVVTLHESETKFARLTAKTDLLAQPPYNEAREGWTYFVVPLAGDEQWKREGVELRTANYLTIGFDSWGAPPLRIWVDGLALK
jgi:parallel beta-helix repeat protein